MYIFLNCRDTVTPRHNSARDKDLTVSRMLSRTVTPRSSRDTPYLLTRPSLATTPCLRHHLARPPAVHDWSRTIVYFCRRSSPVSWLLPYPHLAIVAGHPRQIAALRNV